MKQQLGSYLGVAALLIGAAACTSEGDSTVDGAVDSVTTSQSESTSSATEATPISFPLSVEDCDRTVTLDAPPERILTVGSVAVNMLHAAGVSDRVTARSGEFGTPTAGDAGRSVVDAPVLVDDDPATEAVLGTEVDFVYGYGLFNTTAEDLAAAGIQSLVTAGYCGSDGGGAANGGDLIEVVLDEVVRLGTIFGTTDEATAAVESLRDRLDAVETDDRGTVAGVYWFGDDPSAYGGDAMLQAMLDRLGATNVFGEAPEAFLPLDIEALLDADPDTIILVWGFSGEPNDTLVRDKLADLPGSADLRAVTNDRVISLPSIYVEPDVAAIDGIETLAEEFAALPGS